MKPKVILNEIDIYNLDFRLKINASVINSEAKDLLDRYNLYDIKTTYDNKDPYVIIVCSFNRRADDSDRNFDIPF